MVAVAVAVLALPNNRFAVTDYADPVTINAIAVAGVRSLGSCFQHARSSCLICNIDPIDKVCNPLYKTTHEEISETPS